MKNRLLTWSILLISALALLSCEELENIKIKEVVEPNTLAPLSSTNVVLESANAAQTAITFSWSSPDYGFKAGPLYALEMDIAGNDFADPFKLVETRNLTAAVKVSDLNTAMLALGQTPNEVSIMEFRVVSQVNNNVDIIYSNTREASITPYATSFPPIWGMGAALKGWGPWPDNAVEWQSSEFRKYETIAYFTSGETFRWFAQLGWDGTSYNYPFFTTVSEVFENALDGDSNLKVVGTTGWYRVGVDLNTKTVTAEAVDEPVMYITGAGIGGWDQPGTGASVKMTYLKPGVFEAEANFISGETFRFFAQANWSPTSYNYPYFESVDPLFENAEDGDLNFKYIGETGTQKVTVDINAKTVTVGDPPLPVLYITGDDFGWGWDAEQYVEMTYTSGTGNFTASVTLTNGNLFRFFPQTNWSPSYTFDYFTTVDPDLENQGAGTDQNFKYIGTTGTRTITVNLTTKVVSLD